MKTVYGAPAIPPGPRSGIPWAPYTYNGTGRDTLTAWMDDLPGEPARTGRSGPVASEPCGTEAAARRHRRRGEKPCGDCLAGERRAWHQRKLRAAP